MPRLSKSIRRHLIEQRAAVAKVLRSFRRKDDGIAAVEFALIVPIMAMMTMGAIELSEAVTVDRRVSQVAATTGDLVTQFDKELTQDDAVTAGTIGSWMMKPYDLVHPNTGNKLMKITMTFIHAQTCTIPSGSSTGTTTAGGSCSNGAAIPSTNASIRRVWECVIQPGADGKDASPTCACHADQYTQLPTTGSTESLLQYNTSPSLLITKLDYSYKPKFFDFFLSGQGKNVGGTYVLKDTIYNKPRNGTILDLKRAAGDCKPA